MLTFDWVARELEELSGKGLARDPGDGDLRERVRRKAEILGLEFVDASSNDYLGYASGGIGVGQDWEAATPHAEGREARLVSRETPSSDNSPSHHHPVEPGAGASRLLGGTRQEHTSLEGMLARWTGRDEALLFSSGYAANLGLLASLPQRGDIIFSDALNHASIVDGCRLSRAETVVYPHLDADALRQLIAARRGDGGHRYIVTESYFSMDADSPELDLLREIATENQAALIVDEAHALGVFGPKGAGLAAQQGVEADIVVGTLGKAVGLQGAFVAAPRVVRAWLWNRARSFVYSTGSTPALAHLTMLHVKHLQEDNNARTRLHERAVLLRNAVQNIGLAMPPTSHGPIVPILLGSNESARRAANALRDRGILAYPVRPPTVPKGTARIRLTVNASTTTSAFEHLLRSLAPSLLECGAPPTSQ